MFKQDLTLRAPLMNAAGTLGFAPEARAVLDWDFGAFVTNPISLRPRAPAANPDMRPYPGGFLLHSGLPNPGFAAVLKKYAPRWADASLPIIVNLMADRPEETARMVRRLENIENIAAIELGFAPSQADDSLLAALELSLGELPLIICLSWEQSPRLGPRLVKMGARALSLAAPRGALPAAATSDRPLTTGRLFGPAIFPQALEVVKNAARLGLPVIGSGGVYSKADASAMLASGAMAVQVDTVLWRGNPAQ